MVNIMMDNVLDYIEKKKGKHLNELIEFLRFRSISSKSEHKEDMIRAAEWLANNMKDVGIENVKIVETKGHPIVYGDWLKAGEDKPTVLVYGHYDVQPVEPLDLWVNDPFEPTIRDGKIFARGSADDKGQVFTHIKAVESYLQTVGFLPVNIKFLIEGEEEAGSSNLDDFIISNKEMLGADLALISDTEWFAKGMPTICYGLRGITFFEMTLIGPNRDLHSGTFGGAVDNPINVLASIISKLKDEYGRITVPGFYDDVQELSMSERKEFEKLPFEIEEYKKDLGIREVYGEVGYTTLERVWIRPSLDVNGIFGGYTGEGAKTVLPSRATAKISMRLVPNQKADDIAKKVENYIKQLVPPTMKLEMQVLHGGNPVVVPIDSKAIKAAEKALHKAFHKDVVYMREGGSIPVTELFQDVLNAPPILMGLGLPSDNIHSPNENFEIENFFGGIRASAYFFDEITK